MLTNAHCSGMFTDACQVFCFNSENGAVYRPVCPWCVTWLFWEMPWCMKCVRSSQISLGLNTRDDSMSDLEPCHLILYVTGACCRLNREFELMPGPHVSSMLTSAHECSRMLTAHECSRMHARCSASTLRMAQYTLQSAHVGSSQISFVIGYLCGPILKL